MSRLRIALLFEYPTLNGGERSMIAAIGQLRDRFDLLAIADPQGPLAEELQRREIPLLATPLLDESGRRRPRDVAGPVLAALLQDANVDLLHANSLSMGRLTGAWADLLPCPSTAHLRDIISLSAAAVRDLNRNARLIAVSQATAGFHIAQGLDSARTVTLHNGVDLREFHPLPAETAAKVRTEVWAELQLPQNTKLLLGVGQIGLRKGWDVLAESLNEWAATDPDLHFVLAGERYSHKEESRQFERDIKDRLSTALAGRVRWPGYYREMPKLMATATLLVHPARQEPFGRVLLEAAAAGLPIVATRVGGTAELLTDHESALLVPPDDPMTLAGAIRSLLHDRPLRERLAEAARKRVSPEFSIEQSAQRLENLWKQVLFRPFR